MTDIIMSGCNGHMGRVITDIVSETDGVRIVAGIDINTEKNSDYPVYDSIGKCGEKADAVIDFSSPAVLDDILKYGTENKVPLVLCTTGYSKEQISSIEDASKKVAILRSANMSLGINILAAALKDVAKKLNNSGFDVEIIEKHHRLKKDAPSGTALLLADAVKEGLDKDMEYVYDRSKRSKVRPDDEIGFSAVRGGSIPGDHDVIFAGKDEVITFSHRAYSKAVFGNGAVQAACFLKDKGPGLYTMADVLK